MRKIGEILLNEKNEILEMHINATKNHYLHEATNIVDNYDEYWDYKEENGQYYAKRKGTNDWVLARGRAKKSIESNVFNKNAQNIPPSNAITNPQAGITGGAQSTSISEIVKTIVQNLEGGYYHPDMLRDGRVRDGRYGKSGETMFGMDRLRGGDFVKTPAGQRFWALIDNANARKTWKWNYYGGNLQSELIELTAQMIQPFYDKYSKSYLSPESINIVNNNYKLKFNFVYAVFNGPKLFKHLASLVNNQVASGNTNPDSLANVVLSARLNHNRSLYRQSGKKIKNILGM